MNTLKMTIIIAWRNLWRSKVRSAVVVLAMAIGIWAGIFLSGFSLGMNEQRTDSALSTYLGYAQVHPEGWSEEQLVNMFIPNLEKVEQASQEIPGYVAHTSRLNITGMASSARGSAGVMISGIDPALDTLVCDLNTRLVEGEYFPPSERVSYAYIGTALAEKLKLQLGDWITFDFQNVEGYSAGSRYYIAGMFRTVSSGYDKSTVQVLRSDLTRDIEAAEGVAHEIIYKLKDKESARAWADKLSADFPNLEVESWQDVSPELGYADDMMAVSLYIFIGIILFAITFGILNTMLMAILERKRELGMLMAIGMNKRRTFGMIVLETLFLGTVGAPVGILLGHLTILSTASTGMDLSSVGEGLNAYGMDSVVYPVPVPDYYFGIALMVVIMTLLASLYPAFKALKLNPVEAIRSV